MFFGFFLFFLILNFLWNQYKLFSFKLIFYEQISNKLSFVYKKSKVCTQLRIFQKKIKSTLNQELIHILGVIRKSDYNLKSGCTQKYSWNWKNPKNPFFWAKKTHWAGFFFFKPGFFLPCLWHFDNWKLRAKGVTKRCRVSWLTNSALLYEPKCEGWCGGFAGSQPMSTAVHMEIK